VGIEVLCVVYFANFRSLVDHGVIFWGNSASPSHIFLFQKKIELWWEFLLDVWVGVFTKTGCIKFPMLVYIFINAICSQ